MARMEPGVYIGGITYNEWHARYQWRASNFNGGWWITDLGKFRFKRKEDRLFYLLRWGS